MTAFLGHFTVVLGFINSTQHPRLLGGLAATVLFPESNLSCTFPATLLKYSEQFYFFKLKNSFSTVINVILLSHDYFTTNKIKSNMIWKNILRR